MLVQNTFFYEVLDFNTIKFFFFLARSSNLNHSVFEIWSGLHHGPVGHT